MKDFNRILLPTDGSKSSEVAVQKALSLAQLLKRPIHAVYVVDQQSYEAFPPGTLVVDVGGIMRQEADRILLGIVRRGRGHKIAVTTQILQGHPVDQIVKVARPRDLLVISTHGRTGLSRLLLGSVAESVVRHAPCPVLVIRSPGR